MLMNAKIHSIRDISRKKYRRNAIKLHIYRAGMAVKTASL
jgi:hypothetical protein